MGAGHLLKQPAQARIPLPKDNSLVIVRRIFGTNSPVQGGWTPSRHHMNHRRLNTLLTLLCTRLTHPSHGAAKTLEQTTRLRPAHHTGRCSHPQPRSRFPTAHSMLSQPVKTPPQTALGVAPPTKLSGCGRGTCCMQPCRHPLVFGVMWCHRPLRRSRFVHFAGGIAGATTPPKGKLRTKTCNSH
jgi:hypothetical protein